MYVFVQISLYNLENTQKLIQFWSDSKIYNRPCIIPNPVMNLMTELDKYGNDIVAFSSARLDSLFKNISQSNSYCIQNAGLRKLSSTISHRRKLM